MVILASKLFKRTLLWVEGNCCKIWEQSFKEYSSIQVDIKVDWKIKWVILFYICFVKKAKIIIFFWIYIWISRRKKEEGKKKGITKMLKYFTSNIWVRRVNVLWIYLFCSWTYLWVIKYYYFLIIFFFFFFFSSNFSRIKYNLRAYACFMIVLCKSNRNL